MANINEMIVGWGFAKQTDLVTANLVGGIWRPGNLNRRPWAQRPVAESDANEIGKGHEFATALFKSHYDPPAHSIEKYVSSEMLAWVLAFGLGKTVVSGAGPYTYTITPMAPATDGIDLPSFSYLQQIRPGGSAVLDQMFVGCVVKGWALSLKSGPGRASAMIRAELAATGKYTEPSGITIPAAPTLHEMNAGSLALTINGVDYVTPKSFISLDAGWDNGVRSGFFPGSGSQDGFQIQGRMEVGDRAPSFNFVARYANGSTELTKLRALTTGTAVATLTYDTDNTATLTWQKMAFSVAEVGEDAGIVTISVTAAPMYHATNGLFSAVVKTAQGGICQ